MSTQVISANRSELLKLKDKIKIASMGHSLLKKKRDGLIMDFFKLLDGAKDIRKEMQDLYIKSQTSLKKTRVLTYDLELKLMAKSIPKRELINFQSINIMGLKVPKIKSIFKKRNLIERNKTVYSSFVFDETIKNYEELLEKIIIIAEIETALIKLLDEIEKTKRRVNGLEFNIIPNLKEKEKFVKLSIEEQERDNLIKLKKIKSKISK
jgi:V/A-type H+-transporting ATPase subunit D